MGKKELAKALDLIDKNDPTDRRIKKYAVLMFSEHPEDRIPYAYTELIVDMFGTKRKMESKVFKGAVWKQYYAALTNGFTPRLHLLKVGYPMNDESTLRDAGCFFYG